MEGQEQRLICKGILRESGVELLRYRLSLERDDDEALDTLLCQIVERVEAFCKGPLAERARCAFLQEEDARSRACFSAFVYSLAGEIISSERAYRILRIEATLRRRGEREPLQTIKKEYKWY